MKRNKETEAIDYLCNLNLYRISKAQECLSSCAVEGNALAEHHSRVLQKLLDGKKVNRENAVDLAYFLKGMFDENN